MNAWYSTPDTAAAAGQPRALHAVLSGRVCSRRAVVDEHGHTASVMVLEIGSRRSNDAAAGDHGHVRQESYLTMLLLSGEKEGWGRSRVLGDDEERPAGGMTLVVDGAMRVRDLVRYASGVLEKGD